ncbi:MAG: DUF2283 domain-containing protein [Desulfobacterales bacterium]|nr:DUF2283 domain-containing protein [Desulfobacterales bacterium]
MKENEIYLAVSENDADVAYLYFPGHPGKGKKNVVKKQTRLSDVIENYKGPDIYLDLDHDGNIIGLEILL